MHFHILANRLRINNLLVEECALQMYMLLEFWVHMLELLLLGVYLKWLIDSCFKNLGLVSIYEFCLECTLKNKNIKRQNKMNLSGKNIGFLCERVKYRLLNYFDIYWHDTHWTSTMQKLMTFEIELVSYWLSKRNTGFSTEILFYFSTLSPLRSTHVQSFSNFSTLFKNQELMGFSKPSFIWAIFRIQVLNATVC